MAKREGKDGDRSGWGVKEDETVWWNLWRCGEVYDCVTGVGGQSLAWKCGKGKSM